MEEDRVLELLEAADWKRIIRELTLFAVLLARRYGHLGTDRLLPGGKTPEEMAFEAIEKIWQGKRSWDPVKYPNLLVHLKWIVRSDVGHLFGSKVFQKVKRFSETSSAEEDCPEGEFEAQVRDDQPEGTVDPETELIRREQQTAEAGIKDELYALVEGDEDLQLLLLCFEEGLDKPEAIAAQMGREVTKVYNLKKKLLRRAAALRERLEKKQREPEKETV